MVVAKKAEVHIQEMHLIADGVQAFKRGEILKADWPQAKQDGWNSAHLVAQANVYLQDDAMLPAEWRMDYVGA